MQLWQRDFGSSLKCDFILIPSHLNVTEYDAFLRQMKVAKAIMTERFWHSLKYDFILIPSHFNVTEYDAFLRRPFYCF